MRKLVPVLMILGSITSAHAVESTFNCVSVSYDLLNAGSQKAKGDKITRTFKLRAVQLQERLSNEDERFGTTYLVDENRSGATDLGVTLYETDRNGGVNIQLNELAGVNTTTSYSSKNPKVVESLKFSGAYLLTSSPVRDGIGTLTYRSIGSNTLYTIQCRQD